MKLCMVGTGYVGLVSGACFAETGQQVVCADVDKTKIDELQAGRVTIFEPGLEDVVERNVSEGRLRFSNDVAGSIADSTVVFVAVGTPARSDGGADLSAVDAVAENVAKNTQREMVLVLKSTVPIGTHARVRRIVEDAPHRIHVVSNPEFLKEGDAVNDFMRPDRVVIGCDQDDKFAHEVMGRLYHPVSLDKDRLLWMDAASAEITKYVSNTMLAMRISFMNEVAALCDTIGANVHSVRQGVGSDARIGPKFLYAGPGYGGSCLVGEETVLVREAGRTRLEHLDRLFARHASESGADLHDTAVTRPQDLEVLAWDPSTGQARFRHVSALTCRAYEGRLIELKTKMGRRVRCTPDHPFAVLDPATDATTTRTAEQLDTTHWLPLTKGAHDRSEHSASVPEYLDLLDCLPLTGIAEDQIIVRPGVDVSEMLRCSGVEAVANGIAPLRHERGRERAYDIARSGVLRLHEARALGVDLENAMLGTARNGTYIPRKIRMDARFWRIVGLYLAEGHRSVDGLRHRLSWSFHPEGERELVQEVAEYWAALGVQCEVRSLSTTQQVSISSRLLSALWIDVLELGTDCYTHRIPDAIWDRSVAEKKALLAGLWRGDGSWSYVNNGPSVVLEYGTVSSELADGMLRLLSELGIVARQKIGRTAKSTRDTHWFVIAGADQIEQAIDFSLVGSYDAQAIRYSFAQANKRIAPTGFREMPSGRTAVRVWSKEEVPFQGFVYSMEVPGWQTFITTGGLVTHNCFPKDVKALVHAAREQGVELELAATTDRVNERQKSVLARKLKQHFDGDLRNRRIAVWGLSFKPRTDDVRESPALTLIETLRSEGADVAAHDPEAIEAARAQLGDGVEFPGDAYTAARGADALVLVTEWRQYQNPDFERLLQEMRYPLLIDGRNIWSTYGLRAQGFVYEGVGVQGA